LYDYTQNHCHTSNKNQRPNKITLTMSVLILIIQKNVLATKRRNNNQYDASLFPYSFMNTDQIIKL